MEEEGDSDVAKGTEEEIKGEKDITKGVHACQNCIRHVSCAIGGYSPYLVESLLLMILTACKSQCRDSMMYI